MIHSEIHVLYVTVFELLVLCACGQFKSPEYLSIAVSFAMLTLLGALVFDLHQHRIEATQFRSIDLAELQTELRTAGLLQ